MALDPSRLWAKSQGKNEPFRESMLLPQHLKDVHAAAERVLKSTADDQLRALGLVPVQYRERFERCVRLAAGVHDLGKANDHFQGMLLKKPERSDKPQGLRHEWVTVLMLRTLRDWLLPAVDGNETDLAIVEWAVAGHHPAADHASPPPRCPAGAGPEIRVRSGHPEFLAILAWLRSALSLGGEAPPTADVTRNLVGSANVFADLMQWAKVARRTWDGLNEKDRRFVAAVKDCLIAADVAGSALPREIAEEAKRWDAITTSLVRIPATEDLQFLADYGLEGNKPREFQTAVAEAADEVVFVKAGCGSGKTVAAYMRAARRYRGRRLYFCYPTTGTATEGFKDYLFPEVPEPGNQETEEQKQARQRLEQVGADLFHSRSAVDFEIILGTGSDAQRPDTDAAIRAEALDAWSTPVVACTVDAVLGIVQNNKRGLFAWPALAQSAFVFDEIHAYDDRLFGALLRFLRDLPGLPCLLMTASLPTPRLESLRQTLKQFRNLDLNTIPGPTDLEELPRYHKATLKDNDPLPLVKETLDAGGKVLWVCNTVGRVMDAARRAEALGLKPLIYHSRFKYEDRVKRHKAVIDAFKGDGAALAICSQVAEMSLDLSADLLVSDLAPVPATIQRLGRLNRRAKQKGEPTKPFVAVEHDREVKGWHLPYTPADLDAATKWLGRLPERDIAQCHLAGMWEQNADNPPDLVPSAWLDGGPTTTVAELREASPGITVLMEEDLPRVRATPKQLGRFALPMPPSPRSIDWRTWAKERGLPVAEPGTITYDPMRGAEWQQ